MKNIIAVATIISLSASFVPKTEASSIAQNLCEYVNVDNKSKLRSYLKTNRLKIRNVFDGIQCNGQNLLAFAASRNATETGAMMIGKLSKKVVETNLTVLANSELASVAQKRVNG